MVGNNIHALREKKALTVRALSKMSGVATNTIVDLEQGKRKAYPSTIKKLADALGISVEKLTKEK